MQDSIPMKPITCYVCDGTGMINTTENMPTLNTFVKCPNCKGRGTVVTNAIPGGVDPGTPKPKTLL